MHTKVLLAKQDTLSKTNLEGLAAFFQIAVAGRIVTAVCFVVKQQAIFLASCSIGVLTCRSGVSFGQV